MDLSLLFPLIILLLFIPIFLNGRKQKRQAAQLQELQGSLNDGDVVVTTSGLRGTVMDTSYEETIDLEIAPGVITTWIRAAVREKVKPQIDSTDGTDSTDSTDSAESTGSTGSTENTVTADHTAHPDGAGQPSAATPSSDGAAAEPGHRPEDEAGADSRATGSTGGHGSA